MKRAAGVLVALVGLAAPVGVVFATHALADTLGRDFGGIFASSVGLLKLKAGPVAEAPPPPLPSIEAEAEREPVSGESSTAASKGRRGPPAAKSRAPVTLGVRVSARQVVELARRQAIPQAFPVAAQGPRPAGLRLVGVAGLGVGMKDGDVLTSVAGVPVTSVPAVADLVIRARGRLAAEISAEFWRGSARGALVVEQPYVGANSTTVPTSTTSAESSTGAAAP